jgi:hypothetical protein
MPWKFNGCYTLFIIDHGKKHVTFIDFIYHLHYFFVCLSDHKFVAITFLFVHLRGAAGCCALGRAACLPRRTAFHWLRDRHAPVTLPDKGIWGIIGEAS